MTNETLGQNSFKEQLEKSKKLKELIEFYTVNGLAKPIYTETKNEYKKEPTSDDTLSRLEALAQPPEIKTKRTLEGAFFPLGMTPDDDWLCVLLDGTIMRLKPPKDNSIFLSDFYYADEIKIGNNINDFLTRPTNFFWGGEVVYRNDYHSPNLGQRIQEDLTTAKKVAEERKRIVDEQKRQARNLFLEIFRENPPEDSSPNPPPEEV